MSDVPVPSYRIRASGDAAESGAMRRLLMIAGGLIAAALVAAAVVWGIGRVTGSRSVPLVEADPRPMRVRPADPGGLQVPNQGEMIFNRDTRQRDTAAQGRTAALAPQSEAPDLARLRQQASPPPPAPTPAAPPARPAAPAVATTAAPRPTTATPTTATSAAEAARPATSTRRPTVQLGALATEAAARAEWDRLARLLPADFQGRQPTISPFLRDGQPTLYRLRAAGLADPDAARAFCDRVRGRGGACNVVGG